MAWNTEMNRLFEAVGSLRTAVAELGDSVDERRAQAEIQHAENRQDIGDIRRELTESQRRQDELARGLADLRRIEEPVRQIVEMRSRLFGALVILVLLLGGVGASLGGFGWKLLTKLFAPHSDL